MNVLQVSVKLQQLRQHHQQVQHHFQVTIFYLSILKYMKLFVL